MDHYPLCDWCGECRHCPRHDGVDCCRTPETPSDRVRLRWRAHARLEGQERASTVVRAELRHAQRVERTRQMYASEYAALRAEYERRYGQRAAWSRVVRDEAHEWGPEDAEAINRVVQGLRDDIARFLWSGHD